MADTNRDINLRIRAQDYSKKTLKELQKTIGNLTKAQEDQQKAAAKGESTARDLEKSYQDLERATKAAVRQAADVKAFENQSAALKGARDATIVAQDAFKAFETTLKNTPKVTSDQTKELNRLRKEMEQAEKNEARQTTRLESLEKRLSSYGVAIGGTQAALTSLERMVTSANTSLERQEKAFGDNERALKALKKAEEDAAKQELAAAIDRQRKALEGVAKDAIAAADGWKTVAGSARQFGSSVTPTTTAINGLIGATSPLGKSVKDISTGMRAMTTELNGSNSAINDAKSKIKSLDEAQRQLSKAGGMVDSYREQISTLRQSRAEYSAAQRNVRDLAAQLSSAGDGAKDIQNKLSSAQTALGRSAKAFRDNAEAARLTRSQLQELGVTTQSVGAAESQLVGVTNQVVSAQRALTDALSRSSASALNEQSSAMQAAATEARTMAVGMNNVATSATPVSDAIKKIISPANDANSTLSKMEDNASMLAASFSTIRGPVKDATKKFNELAEVQKSISKTAGLVDTFNRQKAAVGAARAEYKNAQKALSDLDREVRNGSVAESELASRVSAANDRVKEAARAFRESADAAKQTRDQLSGVGINSSNSADAMNRLTSAANNAARAERELTDATDRYGRASRSAGETAKNSMFTAQGAAAKLRNEILGVTAAYTGLQGAMTLSNNVIDAAISKQQFMSQVSASVGTNVEKQAEQWEFINKMSQRWGLDVTKASNAYSKLLVSVTASGHKVKDAQSLFEDLAIVGSANNLNTDQFDHLATSIEQMISKGQIMSEELKTQAGNVLPGIYEQAAIILNGSVEGFAKKLQDGFYKTEAVFELTKGLSKKMINAADAASQGLVATQNRLKNAMNDFNLEVGNSGFIDSYTNMLKKLTNIFRSDDGKVFARKVGAALSTAADAAQFLADHIDAVIAVLKILAGVMAAKLIMSFAGTIRGIYLAFDTWRLSIMGARASMEALIISMRGANIATKVLTVSMKLLGYAVPFIGWALLIFDFIAAVYQASDTFRDFCWGSIIFWKAVIDYFYSALTGAYEDFETKIRRAEKWADQHRSEEDQERLGIKKYDQYSAKDDEYIKKVTGKDSTEWQDEKGAGYVPKVYREGEDGKMNAIQPKRVTDETSLGFDQWDQRSKRFEDENKKLNEKINRDMKSQDKKTYRDMLDERIAMVREEYAPRLEEAEALANSGKNPDARLKAEQTMNRAIELERKKFWNEVGKEEAEKAAQRAEKIKELEATIQQNRDQIDSTSGSNNWDPSTYSDRESTYIDSQVGKYKDLEAQIRKVGGAEGERLQAMVNGLKTTTAANAQQTYQLQELERYNQQIKNLEEERNAKISTYKAQKEAYMLTDSEYVEKVNEAYNESKQALLDATAAAEKFGEANRNAFKTDAEYAKFKANIQNMRTETQASGNELATYQKQAAEGLAQSVNTGFSALVENITAVREGTESWSDAFQNVAAAMLQYFAQLLQQIAMTIIQAAIMRALLGGAPPAAVGAGTAGVSTVTAGTNHGGGMAGSSGIGSQRISALSFANAQRYHTGGMIGLQPDEVPIIAEKGEEMLTRDDPRNRLNGGLNGGDGGNTRIIAVDDQRAAVTEALKTPAGEKALITVLRSNLSTIKKMVNN